MLDRVVYPDFIIELGRQLLKQDNACTAEPVFVVQSRKRVYGIDLDYTDKVAWIAADECEEVASDEQSELEKAYQETDECPDGYRRVGYEDTWEFVMAFFSRANAETYVEANAHRHVELRIYVDSAYRNKEWQTLRQIMMGSAKQADDMKALKERAEQAETDRAVLLRLIRLRDECYICGAARPATGAVPHCDDSCSVEPDGEADYVAEWKCEHDNAMKALKEIRGRLGR